jgi:hypothetical protein
MTIQDIFFGTMTLLSILFVGLFIYKVASTSFLGTALYEDRGFKVKKSLSFIGKFNTKLKDIKLYDLDRDEYGRLIEDSPLYVEIALSLSKELKLDLSNPDFDIRKVFINLNNKDSESYKTYVHIMRCLTNFNFEAIVMKGLKYDFSWFNRHIIKEVEEHTDAIIVEVGSYMVEQIADMINNK